jgi:bifunctional non-homologous end joining protein LigD
MPLEEYRTKRDFAKTPEPAGAGSAGSVGLLYVVQKHAASRLHWDFRIELDGVLLSWAVPKGPSLDIADKRLAMHVEDHPVEYGSFEGTIPKGEYGGGTVMLWDRGTWQPDHGDPRAHLEQGHLKFYLFGERLRGRWMLVKTKGYGGKGDSWLLFKERDEEARPKSEFDAVKEWTTSVATGRTMEQISLDADAVYSSTDLPPKAADAEVQPPLFRPPMPDLAAIPGAVEAPIPKHIDVELATLVKSVPEGDGWMHEVKYDGYRILGRVEGGKVRLVSRNDKDWTDKFSVVAEQIAGLGVEDVLLDGEVVVVKPDGASDFQALQNYVKRHQQATLQYCVFDLLYVNGYDLRGCRLGDRKDILRALVPPDSTVIRYTDHIEGHGDVFFDRACEYALEGVVSKRRESTYRSGRGRDWLKSKCLQRQEFVVVGYTDPGGSRAGFGALAIGVHEPAGLRYVGRVGTGFTERTLADLYAELKPLLTDKPPVMNPPSGAEEHGLHWVEPTLVAEVAFAEWTAEGALRHPSFLGMRVDKPAEQVVLETPAEMAGDSAADPAGSQTAPPTRRGKPEEITRVAGVVLTNPNRVFWPEIGFTKLDLVRFYEQAADRILPHVADRPLSLVRCPNGYTGECFYQKHVENFPSAVLTVEIQEGDGGATVHYPWIDSLSGLVGLAQMGVLEIHPWGARRDNPDKPDRLVFDLDPDPALPWSQVAATALLLRSELGRLGLRSWLKTTGGKGLHVVVPITRRTSWPDARSFARAFVDSIVRIEPRMFTSNMRKGQRDGRIFIDYLRNSRGATAVAPYSTRAREWAPVSMPMAWEELEQTAERPVFTVANVADRLHAVPDPWADIASARQSITGEVRKRLVMPNVAEAPE